MTPSVGRRGSRWVAIACGIAILAAVGGRAPTGLAAQPSYSLYFTFQIPPVALQVSVSDSGAQISYSGTLQGTLGGLPVKTAKFTYGPGASKVLGGGTFSMATDAGPVQDGQILMSTDGQRTLLLCFGVYLGTRLEFTLVGDGPQMGGVDVRTAGLAPTGFPSHDAYVAAVRQAVATLPEATRQQIAAAADSNLRLVNEYQQRTGGR